MVTSRKKLDFWFWVKVVVIGFMLIFLIYLLHPDHPKLFLQQDSRLHL